jgi:hypothetical protein
MTRKSCGQRLSLERREPCANAQGLRIKRLPHTGSIQHFSVRVSESLAGIEPVEFRVKSDLRNHQVIARPRLYDHLMVTQITLRTSEPDSEHPSPWPGAIQVCAISSGHDRHGDSESIIMMASIILATMAGGSDSETRCDRSPAAIKRKKCALRIAAPGAV